jgi:hypothetical protein
VRSLSITLAELGRRKEALAAIQEAAAVYRELAAGRLGVFGNALANVLWTRGAILLQLDRDTEALAAFDEHRQTMLDLTDLHVAHGQITTAVHLVERVVEANETLGHPDP